VIAFAIAVCSILAYGSSAHNIEDWRGAIARANQLIHSSDTPVLIHSALIEANQINWLRDPYKASYLDDPVSYYPMNGRIIPMPFVFDAQAREYLNGVLPRLLASHQFFVMTRDNLVQSPEWLEGRVEPSGFHVTIVGSFGSVTLYEFARSQPAA
jgi:hypothetical protein